jgi:multisubunit Na+/H+ antiporter MnhG subunit
MQATTDVHGDAYHALHARSTAVYGGVVLLVLAAMVLGAARRDE